MGYTPEFASSGPQIIFFLASFDPLSTILVYELMCGIGHS